MNYENMTRRRVLCFGDSNTYGYDPARDGRYGDDERYPMVLQDLLGDGWSVVEEGLPGRTAVFDDPITEGMNGLRVITPILMSHAPLDTVTIMLGTNDSKERFGCNSHLISLGIVRLVKKALHTECWRDNTRPDVLVIVPPSITPEYDHLIFKDAMGTGCHERCAGIAAQLEPMLKDIANVRFLDANTLPGAGCSPLDGMHMTVQSHKVLAKALQKELTGFTLYVIAAACLLASLCETDSPDTGEVALAPEGERWPRRAGGREPCGYLKSFRQWHSSLPHRLRAEPPRRGGQVPQHTTAERTLHHGRAKFLGYAAHQARQPDEIRHHRCGLPYAARRGRTIPVDLIAGKSLRCGRGYDFPFLPRLGL